MDRSDDEADRELVDSNAPTLAPAIPPTLPPPDDSRAALELLPTIARSRFRFAHELARGGMGRIFIAADHLDRRIAIKELLSNDAAFAARFEREVRLTARLQHPNIVTIYEAGRWPSGEPFYAMRFVAGKPLDSIVAEAQAFEARLALVRHVLAIAEAVAYAHGQRIIHRDLKPANVLIGTYGEVVVIDWGLAKDLDDPAADPPALASAVGGRGDGKLTVLGSIMGTPSFMPVEQATGMPLDERADVYAIGALLYYVLAGREPYGAKKSVEQILASVRAGPPLPLDRSEPAAPRELAAIVAKAMARNPRDRYPTAKELGEDLNRFITGQLVAAHAYTWRERAARWIARHRTALAVAAVFVVVLAAGAVVSVRSIIAERDRADLARHDAELRADELVLQQARARLDRDPTAAIAWLLRYPDAGPSWTTARTVALEATSRGVARHVLATGGRNAAIAFSPAGGALRLASVDDHGKLVIWDPVAGTSHELGGDAGRTLRIAFSPDGKLLASTSADGTARIWDVASGAGRLLAGPIAAPGAIAFSPDSARLVAIAPNGGIRVWDVAAGTTRVLAGHDDGVLDVSFTPDGRVVSSSRDRTVRLWNAELDGAVVVGSHDDHAMRVAVSSRGVVASAGRDHTVRVWDASSNRSRVVVTHAGAVTRAVFSSDGRWLASGGDDRLVWLWNAEDDKARELDTGDGPVHSLAFSPDGGVLAVAHGDKAVQLWDVATGTARALLGHDGVVTQVAFSPDGAWLATASDDKTIRIWPALDANRGRALVAGEALVDGSCADGGTLVTSGARGRVARWDLAADRPSVVHDSDGGGHVARSRGDRIAWSTPDHRVVVWDAAAQRPKTLGAHDSDVTAIVFSRDGGAIATASSDKTVRVWGLDGRPSWKLEGHAGGVWTVAFAHGSDRLASGGFDGTVRLWQASGRGAVLGHHDGYVNVVAWAPDDATIASAGTDGAIRLWDVARGTSRDGMRFNRTATALRYAPSGGWLVAGDEDGVVVRISAQGSATRLGHHRSKIVAIAIAADSRWAASASDDGTLNVWASDGGDQATLAADPKPTFVALCGAAPLLVAGGPSGIIRVWDLAGVHRLSSNATVLRASLEALTTARVGDDNSVATRR